MRRDLYAELAPVEIDEFALRVGTGEDTVLVEHVDRAVARSSELGEAKSRVLIVLQPDADELSEPRGLRRSRLEGDAETLADGLVVAEDIEGTVRPCREVQAMTELMEEQGVFLESAARLARHAHVPRGLDSRAQRPGELARSCDQVDRDALRLLVEPPGRGGLTDSFI